jgi:hypothetical protein
LRTTTSSVTFARPFSLPGFNQPHAPGTFEVRTDEEALDLMSVAAWRRVATTILLVDLGRIEAWAVEPVDLEAAVRLDQS